MSENYQNLTKKRLTVIYECGYKCKKLRCELLEYHVKNSKEKFLILKTFDNLIYHLNCDKIVYLIADYKDMFPENEENIDFSSTNFSMKNEAKTSDESESLNKKTTYDKSEENVLIPLESEHNYNSLLVNAEDPIINSDEHAINYVMTDMEFNHEKVLTDYKEANDYNQTIDQYKNKDILKMNFLSSSLANFINCNFQGVNLTIYTTSAETISGEVIFNYDFLIIIKSDEKTYYINPEQISHFY